MLAKTLHIKNVGRFNSTAAAELAQATVLYAENGRGKSTLAAILRSLKTGEPVHILERKALGVTGEPTVSMLATINAKNVPCTFDGKTWNTAFADCEIFDATFVAENVFSGSEVDPEHRRRLHKFVLGAANVALARTVDDLDDQIRAATESIAAAESDLAKCCLSGLSPEDFIKAPNVADFDTAIQQQEAIVEVARAADTISNTKSLDSVAVPTVDSNMWDKVLARTLEEVELEAEALVRKHIADNGATLSEEWLSEGLKYLVADACPMCASEVGGSALIRAYKTYFSTAYGKLKRDVVDSRTRMQQSLDVSVYTALTSAIQANSGLSPFWARHEVQVPEAPAIAQLERLFAQIRDIYDSAFAKKIGNVLEPVDVVEDTQQMRADAAIITECITTYNQKVSEANTAISEVKVTAAVNSLSVAVARLTLLRNGRVRHSAAGDAAVVSLQTARAVKKKLESEKKTAKDALDKATQALFSNYQLRINTHLANCGCGYSITGTKTVYTGGKSRTEYRLVINNQTIDLASPKTGIAPSFKNTLSDGDKSTLAFAFFLAKLDLDQELAEKVIVLDDPVTSLDAHRRRYTCQRIVGIAPLCRQLILLTHDAPFARQVWDSLPKPKTALFIDEHSGCSHIAPWDIVKATQADYFVRHSLISDFCNSMSGDRTAVATSLRPLLEGNLRMRFPDRFGPDEWLGDFIKKVKNATPGDILVPLQGKLAILADINDYAKQFHHDQNPAAAQVKPVDAELKAYARQTLDFAAGLP